MRGERVERIFHREIDAQMACRLSYRIAGFTERDTACQFFLDDLLIVDRVDQARIVGRWISVVESDCNDENDLVLTVGSIQVHTYSVKTVWGAMGFLVGDSTGFTLMRVFGTERFHLTLYCNPELLGEQWRWLLDFFPPEHSPEAVFEAEKLLGNAS